MTQHLRNYVTPRVGNYVTRSARKLRNFMTAHNNCSRTRKERSFAGQRAEGEAFRLPLRACFEWTVRAGEVWLAVSAAIQGDRPKTGQEAKAGAGSSRGWMTTLVLGHCRRAGPGVCVRAGTRVAGGC